VHANHLDLVVQRQTSFVCFIELPELTQHVVGSMLQGERVSLGDLLHYVCACWDLLLINDLRLQRRSLVLVPRLRVASRPLLSVGEVVLSVVVLSFGR